MNKLVPRDHKAMGSNNARYGIALLFAASTPLAAQGNNAIFNGGVADGNSVSGFAMAVNGSIFPGGVGDGSASAQFAMTVNGNGVFNGGIADGHAMGVYAMTSSTTGIFNGGAADGWANGYWTNIQLAIYGYLFLEGPFEPGLLLMRDDLRSTGLVPLTEPYTTLGYPQAAGGGGEVADPALLAISGSDAPVDWVRVELRDAANPTVLVATRQALVLRDGTVVTGGGGSPLQFGVPIGGSYYMVVRHRNHLGCMTATPIAFNGIVPSVNFASAATAVFGTDARKTIGTDRLLWAGDVNSDHQLKYTGLGNDRDPILVRIGGTAPNNTTTGYHWEDVNMDGTVKYTGAANDRDPILVNVGGPTPNNVRIEQVP